MLFRSVTWLIWEIIQTAGVVRLNTRLFPDEHQFDTHLLRRFCFFIAAAFAGVTVPALREARWALPTGVAVAVAISAVLAAAGYFVFQLEDIRKLVMSRMRRRSASA